MNHDFVLADIGEGLDEAEIIRWLVHVGDTVDRDQPLVEVMTDKSNAELPAPYAGIVVELGGAEGDIVRVGELIAVIQTIGVPELGDDGPDPEGAGVVPVASAVTPLAPTQTAQASIPEVHPTATRGRPKASPSTRRVAAERRIDLGTVTGTGPGGRILLSDLDAVTTEQPAAPPPAPQPAVTDQTAAPPPAPQPAVTDQTAAPPPAPEEPEAPIELDVVRADGESSTTVPLRGVRRAIARNMAQSWSQIPHIHVFDEVDAEPLMDLRARLRSSGKPDFGHITPLTFFVAAVARTLRDHPNANASISLDDDQIVYHPHVNVGVAVATDQGLIVPVLHDADHMDLETLSRTLTELVDAARSGGLGTEHFRGGTVTITNFGSLGGMQATPLIRPPESLIFGFGSIARRPFVVDDHVVARQTMHLVAGADHRLLDGDVATAVLSSVASRLADPLQLVL